MRHLGKTLCLFAILGGQPALADQDDDPDVSPITAQAPTFSIVGSLEGTYTDNANVFLPSPGRRSDVYWTPDITLRLDGRLTSDVYYRLYARGEFDAFNDETDANNADARLGVRLSRDIFDWNASLGYENRYGYVGIFDDRLFRGHDLIGTVSRDFELGWATLSPGGLLTYRFADVDEFQRFRLELWLGVEVPIDEKWSVVSEPFFEQFWFTDGLNSGREDQVYSVSLGLQYRLTDDALLTTEVIYEKGESNRPGLDYDFIEIGPRLDFAY